MKLTTLLPPSTPSSLQKATTHPFLRLSGTGQIPSTLLSQWLSQDRLYAQSYVRFIGHLLSKLHLPRTVTPTALSERILTILIDALTNIRVELGFFETVAREYGLDLNAVWSPSGSGSPGSAGEGEAGSVFGAAPVTRAYVDMFMSAGSSGTTLLEGLVVLWATEVCYLRAWRFAAGFLGEDREPGQDADGGALREKFIPNWSSKEFEQFVDGIGEVVDELAEEVLRGLDAAERDEVVARCVQWWKQVVWLEERFWPDVENID